MGHTGTTRRRALATGAGALTATTLLAACSFDSPRPEPRRTLSPEDRARRAEEALRRRTASVSAKLLKAYEDALTAHPALGPRVSPLRAAAAAHVAALAPVGAATPSGAVGPSGPRAAGPASPEPSGAGSDPAATLKELAALASRTAAAHAEALLDAPPELARLLASVAGACAGHAYLLGPRPGEAKSG